MAIGVHRALARENFGLGLSLRHAVGIFIIRDKGATLRIAKHGLVGVGILLAILGWFLQTPPPPESKVGRTIIRGTIARRFDAARAGYQTLLARRQPHGVPFLLDLSVPFLTSSLSRDEQGFRELLELATARKPEIANANADTLQLNFHRGLEQSGDVLHGITYIRIALSRDGRPVDSVEVGRRIHLSMGFEKNVEREILNDLEKEIRERFFDAPVTRAATGIFWLGIATALSRSRLKTPGVSPGMKASPAVGWAGAAGPDF